MVLDAQSSVASFVLEHPACAPVLRRHRIDFCCRGARSLAQSCEEQHVPLEPLLAELAAVAAAKPLRQDERFAAMTTPELIAYIVEEHHRYVREALPFVRAMALKVARVHGAHNPKMVELDACVAELAEVLGPHVDEEERTLFPSLAAGTSPGLREEMERMYEEHLDLGELLSDMREAAEDFHVPEWGCTSYRTLFQNLEALESDVIQHVHLENNVLGPRFRA